MTDKQLKELNTRLNRVKLQRQFKKTMKYFDTIPLYNQVHFLNSIKNNEE